MTHYLAFLRAINVGGHLVKMETLRQIFTDLGLTQVETFIASGNLSFETDSAEPAALEKTLDSKLYEVLGYEVATFLRTPAELAEVLASLPFSTEEVENSAALNVAFLSTPLSAEAQAKLRALETPLDRLETRGREIYWLGQVKQSASTLSNALFEKKLGVKSTLRGWSTLQKLAAKYPPK